MKEAELIQVLVGTGFGGPLAMIVRWKLRRVILFWAPIPHGLIQRPFVRTLATLFQRPSLAGKTYDNYH